MITLRRRLLAPLVFILLALFYYSGAIYGAATRPAQVRPAERAKFRLGVVSDDSYFWRKREMHYPPSSIRPLPVGRPHDMPKVQAKFGPEPVELARIRRGRLEAVKRSFERSWSSYKKLASPDDELTPISGGSRNPFGGWGVQLVDSLDTLWIMGLKAEFEAAVQVAAAINFTSTELQTVNVFETTIRHLGGFLAAYDLSGDQRLLRKAREVGDMLYVAFDTPNRMPVTRWDLRGAARGEKQVAGRNTLLAEIGSLGLEFTRLSLITGDPKWYDAAERIREKLDLAQETTAIPGLWPITVNARDSRWNLDNTFGLGSMADSAYEYLPKMVALTGGLVPQYSRMYMRAMRAALDATVWRPMTPDNADILVASTAHVVAPNNPRHREVRLDHQQQHLACYAGGMLALGGKLMRVQGHLDAARKLTDGCVWAYKNAPMGIMPELLLMAPCRSRGMCRWDETAWKREVLKRAGMMLGDTAGADRIAEDRALPRGWTDVPDARYLLRPEAIESVFVLYRATGRRELLESAWAMFQAVDRQTRTPLANAALADVMVPEPGSGSSGGNKARQTDSMESFWLGETLKYFYLIFSEPHVVSLDEWVFNTEAHPFRRLTR